MGAPPQPGPAPRQARDVMASGQEVGRAARTPGEREGDRDDVAVTGDQQGLHGRVGRSHREQDDEAFLTALGLA